MSKALEAAASRLTHELIQQGKIIEAGFVGYRAMVLHKDAPEVQIRECRLAFYAGAKHLFDSIMHTLDDDAEPTEADLERVEKIDQELQAFGAQVIGETIKTEGRA